MTTLVNKIKLKNDAWHFWVTKFHNLVTKVFLIEEKVSLTLLTDGSVYLYSSKIDQEKRFVTTFNGLELTSRLIVPNEITLMAIEVEDLDQVSENVFDGISRRGDVITIKQESNDDTTRCIII